MPTQRRKRDEAAQRSAHSRAFCRRVDRIADVRPVRSVVYALHRADSRPTRRALADFAEHRWSRVRQRRRDAGNRPRRREAPDVARQIPDPLRTG